MIESGPSGLLVHSGSGTVALPPGRRLAVGSARISTRGALSFATKPICLWVASQNGLFEEWPQRQSATAEPSGRTNSRPSASTMVIGPVILYGPFSRT